jgi:hypothetical protein
MPYGSNGASPYPLIFREHAIDQVAVVVVG